MVDLEARVGAVEFVLGAAAALQLVDTFARKWHLRDALELHVLLFGWQELLLLLLEEERAMVKTLHEVRIAELLPFSDLVFFVRLKFFQVVFHALNPDGDQVDRMLSNHSVDLLEVHDLVRHLIFIEMLDEGKMLLGEEAGLVVSAYLVLTPFLCLSFLLG